MKIRKYNAIIALISASLALSSCIFIEKGETPKTPTESTLLAVDDRANSYVVGEIFDNYVTNGGLTPKVRMSDNTEKVLTKTDFTYEIKTAADSIVTGTKPFTASGNYTVTVSKLKLKPVSYTIRVNPKEEPTPVATLTSISVTGYSDEVYQGDDYVFSGTVIATYSDKTTKDVTSKANIGTISTDTLGEKQLRISYKEGDVTRQLVLTIKVVEKPAVDVKITSITFFPTSKSLVVGNTYTVTPTITPSNATNKSLTWSSPNSDVAIVSNGQITAKAVGNVRITATAKDGSNKSAFIDIEVTPVLVTKITLSLTSKTIEVGDTFNLSASITPSNATNKEVEWTASNSSVATVSGGTVTTVGVGSATITATAKDGSGCQATCSVTVNAKPIKVTSITLSDTSINLTKGSTKALTATVGPSNATNKNLTWKSSNSTVATYNSTTGLVSALKSGTATITATAQDGSGTKSTCTVNVTTPVTGISLNKTTLSLNKGASETLTATIAPSDADNKNVTWSGSTDKISVDQTGKVTVSSTATLGQTATIVATSNENSSFKASCVVTVSDAPAKDAWTIMIYMCGADLESSYGQASTDILEILNVKDQPDDVNIVIETGGSSYWYFDSDYIGTSNVTNIPNNKLTRWHVKNQKIYKDQELSNASMGKSSTYESFLKWGLQNYPAEKTGVILWNHGGGLDGVCFDENYNDDALLNSRMTTAHKNAIGSNKLEFIGYDACLMQCADIADANSAYFKYQIASQESEDGSGWYYTGWIDNVYAHDSTTTICKEICDTFISSQGKSSNQTLSYLDLSYASEFKTSFNNYGSALSTKFKNSSVSASTFAKFAKSNIKNYSTPGYCGYGQFDIKDWLNKCQGQSNYKVDSSYVTALNNVLSNYIAYNKTGTGAGNSNGLCLVYCCTNQVYYDEGEYAFNNWSSFNNSYGL